MQRADKTLKPPADAGQRKPDTARAPAADEHPESRAQRSLLDGMAEGPRVQALQAMADRLHASPRAAAQRAQLSGLLGRAASPAEEPAHPALAEPVQLRRGNRSAMQQKRKPRKTSGRVPPHGHMAPESDIDSGDDSVTHYVAAREGEELGHYEEQYESAQLFWRGDTREPDKVFKTGFTSKNERDKVTEEGANRIIWRAGGATDDILPASAVCLAKDIRGGAFFPLTGDDRFFLYAVCKSRVVNTFQAQQDSEAVETGTSNFKREERYAYDPAYEDEDGASAVWQFREYAAHRVDTTEILGCFRVVRRTLVPRYDNEAVAIAGIQFRLEFLEAADFGGRRDWKHQKKLLAEAKSLAARYESFYPSDDVFLSYMGLVKPRDRYNPPQTLEEARGRVRQVEPVVVDPSLDEPR